MLSHYSQILFVILYMHISACRTTVFSRSGESQKPDAAVEDDSPVAIVTANKPADVDIPFSVKRYPDDAHRKNCLYMQINDEPELSLGCNKDNFAPVVIMKAQPFPSCNKIRLVMISGASRLRTTKDASQVQRYFKIEKINPSHYKIQCNDNNDSNYNDLNLEIQADPQKISMYIENFEPTCTDL